jgi:probable addiction module antidote protein
MPVEFKPLDISELLDSEEMIAGFLSAAAEDEDPNVLIGALMHAAKARGMMQVAKATGLNRESLYKALKPGAHPRFETVQAVLRALGVKLSMAARHPRVEEPGGTDDPGRDGDEMRRLGKVVENTIPQTRKGTV